LLSIIGNNWVEQVFMPGIYACVQVFLRWALAPAVSNQVLTVKGEKMSISKLSNMSKLRAVILVLVICLVGIGLLAASRVPPVTNPPIIVKGGSLTIDCGDGTDCLVSNGNGVNAHKNKKGKIHKIVVKDEDGNVLGTFDEDSFPNGKPSIEISYY
jgi:hypothetical protein